MISLVTINTVIFICIAALHFYWAAGGAKMQGAVIPTGGNNKPLFAPGKFVTVAVAAGLLFFAFITVSATGVFNNWLNLQFSFYGNCIIAGMFLLRAVGDFRYIGFFKTVRATKFAVNDTKIYSPLCIFIAIVATLISLKLHALV